MQDVSLPKKMMNRRDKCREKMKGGTPKAKTIIHTKYKLLRNKINSQMRRENVDRNSERVVNSLNMLQNVQ